MGRADSLIGMLGGPTAAKARSFHMAPVFGLLGFDARQIPMNSGQRSVKTGTSRECGASGRARVNHSSTGCPHAPHTKASLLRSDAVTPDRAGRVRQPGHGPEKIISGLMRSTREIGHARMRATHDAASPSSTSMARDGCETPGNRTALKRMRITPVQILTNMTCESFMTA